MFTDIEGSSRAWEEHREAMQRALARHDEILRSTIAAQRGYIFATGGDGFAAAFSAATSAITAAVEAQRALANEPWPSDVPIRSRMALHSGEAEERDGDYFGPTVNRTARLMAAGHGGQVLVSRATSELLSGRLDHRLSLRDLGEHRLRDLTRAEHIFQLVGAGLDSDFASLRTLSSGAHNLPVEVTSFVGRDGELAAVTQLLEDNHLVTLVGVGGVGKTRLALRLVAQALPGFADGVWLVELAPVTDPRAVDRAIGAAAGAVAPISRESLIDFLRGKSCTLLLDNCEHLIDACADLASDVLSSCPEVRLVATSREPLGVLGEHVFRVPSLSLPPKDSSGIGSAEESAAVRLLVERARAAGSDLSVTAGTAPALVEIARRLDGIPLALELAAPRLRAMSADELLQRLHDRFRLLTGSRRGSLERHQTLRAAVDWSYDLLDASAQKAARRLSVFRGGCVLEAAQAVCSGPGLDGLAVLDLLTELVDKSFLLAETGDDGSATRYRLLETINAYLADKLYAAHETAEAEQRHLQWVLSMAGSMPGSVWEQELQHMLVIQSEARNIEAALERAIEDERPDEAARIAATCAFWAWFAPGAYEVCMRLVVSALDLGGGTDVERLDMMVSVGLSALYNGGPRSIQESEEWFSRALALSQTSPELNPLDEAVALVRRDMNVDIRESTRRRALALIRSDPESPKADFVRCIIGFADLHCGAPREAMHAFEQAWERRRHEPTWVLTSALPQSLALARALSGREARADALEAVEFVRALGDPAMLTVALSYQALIDDTQAVEALREGQTVLRRVRRIAHSAYFFAAAAHVARGANDDPRALRLIGAGRPQSVLAGRMQDGLERLAVGELLDERQAVDRDALIAEGVALSFDSALDLALP